MGPARSISWMRAISFAGDLIAPAIAVANGAPVGPLIGESATRKPHRFEPEAILGTAW